MDAEREVSGLGEHPEAPGALAVVEEFVNSVDLEPGQEVLDSPQSLTRWLVSHDLLPAGTALDDPAQVARAVSFREALRELLAANHDCTRAPASALDVVNDVADAAHLAIRVDADQQVAHVPRADGLDGSLGLLVAIVHAAMADGTWARLKVCAADSCRWAYYDTSRNRSRRWCSMSVCGNREKVRAHRARRPGDR